MVTLKEDALRFALHRGGAAEIRLVRTLRVPDSGKVYDLPAGTGYFPCVPVQQLSNLGPLLRGQGGVAIPMWQAEALWIKFSSSQPAAIKIGVGKINAITGEEWRPGLHRNPQDYVVAPNQPWLDGFCVGKGVVRQFVAAPLGSGATAEEQITGAAEVGGIQITVTPLTQAAFLRWEQQQADRARAERRVQYSRRNVSSLVIGVGAGGAIRQHIYPDPFEGDQWESAPVGRVSITILNALVWKDVTGSPPPTPPLTPRQYAKAGVPWFRWYGSDAQALLGSPVLRRLLSVGQTLGMLPGETPHINNTAPIKLGPTAGNVTEDGSL